MGRAVRTVKDYLLLAACWTAWCTLHSVMISLSVTGCLKRRFPGAFGYYRLFYNLVAVATLVPVLWFSFSLRGPVIFSWDGWLRPVQILLILSALYFFAAGGRRYDFQQFLGLRQIRAENDCAVLTEDCAVDTRGVLGMVRHPWYTGGILIVWARPLDGPAILTSLLISAYFVVGAHLEERKLTMHFGEAYRDYQRSVSMFLPFKWIGRCLGQKEP